MECSVHSSGRGRGWGTRWRRAGMYGQVKPEELGGATFKHTLQRQQQKDKKLMRNIKVK